MEFGFLTFMFTGRNGAGPVSVPGLKVGDKLLWSTYDRGAGVTYSAPASFFGFVVTTDDEIEQVDGSNNSTANCEILVYRGGGN